MPLPDPFAPPVIVIQPAWLAAFHEQLVPAVTLNDPAAPVDGAEAPVEPRVKVQGAPDWVMVNVCPPIVIVPVRDAFVVFAAML